VRARSAPFREPAAIRETIALLEKGLRFAGCEARGLELADLVAQKLEPCAAVAGHRGKRVPLLTVLPPRRGERLDFARERARNAMGIDDLPLHVAAHKGLEFLLAVDVDQELAELAYALCGQRLAVHVLARAPVPADDTPQHELTVRRFDRLFLEPAAEQGAGCGLECRRDFRALRAVAKHVGTRAAAECQHHRIHDDGLAGAGFSRERREAALELELGRVDDREVPDLQVREHLSTPRRRSGRCGPSAAWSAAGGSNRGPADAAA
jgi:hypothetical protein